MIFEAENYRNWMKSWLKLKGLTQRDFCDRHTKAVTFTSFVNFLNGTRNLSLPVFLKLLQPFSLKENALYYAVILKLENDLDPRSEENGEAIQVLKKMRQKILPFLRGDFQNTRPLSPAEDVLLAAFQRMTPKQKISSLKYIEEFLHEQYARQRGKKEIKKTIDLIAQLGNSVDRI